MKIRAWTLSLAVATCAHAGLSDSLIVRMGAGIAKPLAQEDYGSDAFPDASFSREIAALPGLTSDIEALLRIRDLEAGMGIGLESEIISARLAELTGFSILHADATCGYRLLQRGNSSIWATAGGGWSFPIFQHDQSSDQSTWGGPRFALGLAFQRESVRVALGSAFTRVSFEDRNLSSGSTTTWHLQYFSMKVYWDWLSP